VNVGEHPAEKVLIYHAENWLHLHIPYQGKSLVNIFDANGKLIETFELQNDGLFKRWFMPNPGIYFIWYQHDNQQISTKILITD